MLEAGTIAALIGTTIGVAGGAIGTWLSIRSSTPGAQRALMIKASIVTWVAVLAFVGLNFLLPSPYNWLLWILYGPLLLMGILFLNRALANITLAAQRPPEQVDS
jgi:ABC-type Na+ efflux pump permease subunit